MSQDEGDSPHHAHVYYELEQRPAAEALRQRLTRMEASGDFPGLSFVGVLREAKVGPHPIPQFEIHFLKRTLPALLPVLEASGLTTLVHPLTDDDLADHTSLGHWIGEPLDLDLTVLDPPGQNQGVARFGQTDV